VPGRKKQEDKKAKRSRARQRGFFRIKPGIENVDTETCLAEQDREDTWGNGSSKNRGKNKHRRTRQGNKAGSRTRDTGQEQAGQEDRQGIEW